MTLQQVLGAVTGVLIVTALAAERRHEVLDARARRMADRRVLSLGNYRLHESVDLDRLEDRARLWGWAAVAAGGLAVLVGTLTAVVS